MAKVYHDIGDSIRVEISFYDENGNLGNPDNVTFKYKIDSNGTPVEYEYGIDAELFQDSTGVFYVDLLLGESKPYYWNFTGSGNIDSAEEGIIYVKKSYFS